MSSQNVLAVGCPLAVQTSSLGTPGTSTNEEGVISTDRNGIGSVVVRGAEGLGRAVKDVSADHKCSHDNYLVFTRKSTQGPVLSYTVHASKQTGPTISHIICAEKNARMGSKIAVCKNYQSC